MKKRQPHQKKDQRPEQAKFSRKSTSTEAQIERLTDLLRIRNRHTYELSKVGISHPAGRINDLKKRGFVIDKQLIDTVDSDGFTHVGVALYELICDPEELEAAQ